MNYDDNELNELFTDNFDDFDFTNLLGINNTPTSDTYFTDEQLTPYTVTPLSLENTPQNLTTTPSPPREINSNRTSPGYSPTLEAILNFQDAPGRPPTIPPPVNQANPLDEIFNNLNTASPVVARRSPVRSRQASPRVRRRVINKHSEQVYTSVKELLRGEYTTNEEIDSLIENFNAINTNKTSKSPSKNYKVGYQKRLNNKIYVENDFNKEQIYDNTKEEVGEIYTFIKNYDAGNLNAPCDLRNLVQKFTTKKKEYLAKILKDYRDNRGDCQNNFEENFDDFSDVLTKFQEDSDGKKYIFSDQILRSYSFKNGDSKASDARKGTLKLNESSTRLVQRERNIFNNMRLFILDNSDDQDMKEWYEDPKVKRFIQQKRLKSYETLKNEWKEWKRKNENRNFGTNFSIRNHRLYVPQPEFSDDFLDKEYINFDEFLKGEDYIGKLKEIYQTDLNNFLKFNGLYDKKVSDNIEYLVSRYDLQRKDRKKELGNIIIFDNRRDYLKIPAVQQGEIRRRCSNGFRMSKRINEAQEPVKECIENISKKIGLIKFSKSPRKKSPKQ